MENKVAEALGKLDPTNDNHWTQDGLPRLETVRILTSNPGLSREDVNAAVPGFARPPVPPQAPAAATPGTGGDETEPAAPAAAQGPLVAAPLAAPADSLDELRGQLADAELNYADACAMQREAKARIDECQRLMDRLGDQILHLEKTTGGNPVQGYLASQRAELEERARRQAAIRDSGVDLHAITAGLRAPIDDAFQRRGRRR